LLRFLSCGFSDLACLFVLLLICLMFSCVTVVIML